MLVYQRVYIYNYIYTGWWLTYLSEKYEFVSWDDEIPNKWKNKIHVPNQQPVYVFFPYIPMILHKILILIQREVLYSMFTFTSKFKCDHVLSAANRLSLVILQKKTNLLFPIHNIIYIHINSCYGINNTICKTCCIMYHYSCHNPLVVEFWWRY